MSTDPVHIPGADPSDEWLTVSVFVGRRQPDGSQTRRIQLDDGSFSINFSMKSVLPLVKVLLDLVQLDIVMKGELTR